MLDDAIAGKQRHERFVERVAASGQVWGLKSVTGWCVSRSTRDETDGREIMPFWSDRAYAQQCAREDWSEYEPAAIPIDQFMERWLPGMAADSTLVGTNWNVQFTGYETMPQQLKDELNAQRSQTI